MHGANMHFKHICGRSVASVASCTSCNYGSYNGQMYIFGHYNYHICTCVNFLQILIFSGEIFVSIKIHSPWFSKNIFYLAHILLNWNISCISRGKAISEVTMGTG